MSGLFCPIYRYEIDDWSDKKEDLQKVLPPLEDSFPNEGDEKYLDGSIYTDYYENTKSVHLPKYSALLLDIISPYLKDFSETSDFKKENPKIKKKPRDVKISSMWWQTAFQGQGHSVHNHGGIGWSSIVYVDYDKKYHAPTKLHTLYPDPWTGLSQFFYPPVEEGVLIIFPAYINHEALPNSSNKRRTIISFNIQGDIPKTKMLVGEKYPWAIDYQLNLDKKVVSEST